MKEISAGNVFITNEWFRIQTGEKFDKLPKVTKITDGRYKTEIYLPTVNVLIAATGNDKLDAIDRLFAKAVEEINNYCRKYGLEVPEVFIKDHILLVESDGKIDLKLNPKYAKKSAIKCPICGGTHFIKTDLPLEFAPDAHIRSQDVYGCVNCGYLVVFNIHLPTFYKNKLEQIKTIDAEISERKEQYKLTHNDEKEMKQHRELLNKLKTELKQRQEWGEDNKKTRSLIESIECEEKFLKEGCAQRNEQDIKQLNYDLDVLRKKKELLQNDIKFLSF